LASVFARRLLTFTPKAARLGSKNATTLLHPTAGEQFRARHCRRFDQT
jgi:hypothetical protein